MPLPTRASVDQGDLALSFAHLLRDDLACGALLLDEADYILAASPEAAALLGLPGHKLTGKHPTHLPDPAGPSLAEFLAPTPQARQRASATNRSLSHLRLRLLDLGEGQPPGRRLLLLQDLTLARRLETDIRQLDRLASVGTLAAEMAHEVKNALVSVRTFADLLLEQHPSAELAESVRHETRRIERLVGQVLRYSRPSTAAFQPVALNALLLRCLQMLNPHLEGRGVTLVSRLGADPDLVHGDEQHLEQAVVNLLLNACEAITRDGTITVETDLLTGKPEQCTQSVADREVRLVIRDTGVGISTEHMAHLFEPFFTTKKTGTGLGLAITRRIIHEHHGLISAESTPGRGTTFQILLPAA
jgi:two-component system sensor histidine kinase HydH